MPEKVEDKMRGPSLDEYRKIELSKITEQHMGQKIKTFGWVTAVRRSKEVWFVDLSAHYRTVKCVYFGEAKVHRYSALTVYATVAENRGRDKHKFELQIDEFGAYNDAVPPPFPLNSEATLDTRLDNGHLRLRLPEGRLFLKARSCLLKIIRDHFYAGEYTEVTPPTLSETQVEGGSTLFKVDYFGDPAFLTQSSQLYLETVIQAAHRVFCIMPSYRAEHSHTKRHLSEYTHVEAELADIDFVDLVSAIENLVSESMRKFYEEMRDDILAVYPKFEFLKIPSVPFRRLRYPDAIEFLRSRNQTKKDEHGVETPFEHGDDIPDAAEKYLVREYAGGEPMFLTHFPVKQKSFYMRKDDQDPSLTESIDLLFPDVGEIVGGSMRKDKYEDLMESLIREEIDPAPYYWYIDLARYGPCKHGGYGLGFERLLMGLMRYDHITEACLYPRKEKRCRP
jgi:asparaginyl-tRNA synthetase